MEGKVGGMFAGAPLLLLTTTGAKSGQPAGSRPLAYTTDNGRLGGDRLQGRRADPSRLVPQPPRQPGGSPSRSARRPIPRAPRVPEGAERQRLFDQMAAPDAELRGVPAQHHAQDSPSSCSSAAARSPSI